MSGKNESKQARLVLEVQRDTSYPGYGADRIILGEISLGPLGGYPGGADLGVHALFDLGMELRELADDVDRAARFIQNQLAGVEQPDLKSVNPS